MSKPRTALIGMPLHSMAAHPGAMTALNHASRGLHSINIQAQCIKCSLLPHCFNQLWVEAINTGCDYFAMIHGDVVPQGPWFDNLVTILKEHDADMVSAIVPLKSFYGLTSTAVAGPGGNCWDNAVRRLTLKEIFEFDEETFTMPDILLNTGLWVCRLNKPWNTPGQDPLFFRQQDRVVMGTDGKLTSQTVSEDWDFSQRIRERGGKVLATRAIKLFHGDEVFNNFTAWGQWSRDEASSFFKKPNKE